MRKTAIPKYRLKLVRGKKIAYLTLPCSKTKKRRDFYLGPWDTPASREKYARYIAQWERMGRQLFDVPRAPEFTLEAGRVTVTQIAAAYVESTWPTISADERHYRAAAIRVLRECFGDSAAALFGPNRLRVVRDAMIAGNEHIQPPRRSWSRKTINGRIQRIAAVFKWAAAHELLPVTIYQALKTVEPLKRGRSPAREAKPVGPAPIPAVRGAFRFLSRQVRAMVRLQLATGMRPGEVCRMRPRDIDRSGPVWTYNLAEHKTAHLGRVRCIYLGPRAQRTLRQFLDRDADTFCFSPAEAADELRARRHAHRKTPLEQGNGIGTNRVAQPRRRPGDAYTVDSYRRALGRACSRAGVERFHPHQLRHSAATAIRKSHGLEAAALILGHSSAAITDAIYAERDAGKAIAAILKIG